MKLICANTARIGGGQLMRGRWIDGIAPLSGIRDVRSAEETVEEAVEKLEAGAGIRVLGKPDETGRAERRRDK